MSRRTVIITILAAVLLVGGAVLYFVADPSKPGSWFPRCPFLMLTGFKCPGCGSQRAIHALLHADFASAWHFNALLTATLPVVGAYVVAEVQRTRWPRFYAALNSLGAIITVFVVIVAWWILRNLLNW